MREAFTVFTKKRSMLGTSQGLLIKCCFSGRAIRAERAMFVCTGEGQATLGEAIKEPGVILLTEADRTNHSGA